MAKHHHSSSCRTRTLTCSQTVHRHGKCNEGDNTCSYPEHAHEFDSCWANLINCGKTEGQEE